MDRLLFDIRAGAFSPGTWLKQIDLEERYGCKRPAIRQALERLLEKRLIGHVPNRGYHVHKPDGRQADEVLEIRLLLETGVAGQIVEKAVAKDLTELRRLAEKFETLIEAGTVLELYEANLKFHRRLLTVAGNDELVRIVDELRQRTSSAPVSQWINPNRTYRSAMEHHEMVEAIEARSAEALAGIIRTHIRQ